MRNGSNVGFAQSFAEENAAVRCVLLTVLRKP